ncbi:hypothetical protein N665_0401s0029 [Sinapis alba]|nr:hypothetical protein N665_0401s0029 [Sinapis alba]
MHKRDRPTVLCFFMVGTRLNSRKAKISWENVCKPKEEGGLGLRSLTETNKVSCLKLIWRILSQSTLWVKWVKRYLIRKGSFWNIKETSLLGSWMWRKLLKYRTLAREFAKVEVRSGTNTSFWFDEWSSLGRSRRHRAEHLIAIDAEIIQMRTRGLTVEDDIHLWKGKGDAYRHVFHTQQTWSLMRVQQTKTPWHKGIWFPGATPKYSVMSWIAVHNRLATGDRLLQWNPQANATCILCNSGVESRNHLFFSCHYTEELWKKLAGNLMGPIYTCIWDEVLNLISNSSVSRVKQFLMRYVFQAAVHTIWMERNGRRHCSTQRPPMILVKFIDKQIRNRISSLKGKGGKHLTQAMVAWFETRE